MSQSRIPSPSDNESSGAEPPETEFLPLVTEILGYEFSTPEYILQALTHSSATSSHPDACQRMEFFGDSIIGMCVSEMVYRRFPDWNEGNLTQVKSMVVSTEGLASCARELGLRKIMRLGRGLASAETLSDSVYADIFESVVTAVYLDGGFESAAAFIKRLLEPIINRAVKTSVDANYKSRLQHLCQVGLKRMPEYVLVAAYGPDHDKTFEVAVKVGRRIYSTAAGHSKKSAEQAAAKLALETIFHEHCDSLEIEEEPSFGNTSPCDDFTAEGETAAGDST